MRVIEYRSLEIRLFKEGDLGYTAEIYGSSKYITTVKSVKRRGGYFSDAESAEEAAKEWIDKDYPRRKIRLKGDIA